MLTIFQRTAKWLEQPETLEVFTIPITVKILVSIQFYSVDKIINLVLFLHAGNCTEIIR